MRNARVVADEATSDLDRRALIELDHRVTRTPRRRSSAAATTASVARPDSPVVLAVRDLRRRESARLFASRSTPARCSASPGWSAPGAPSWCGPSSVPTSAARARSRCTVRRPTSAAPSQPWPPGIALLPEDRKTQGNVMDFSIRHNITLASLPEHRVAPRVAVPSAQSERATAYEHDRPSGDLHAPRPPSGAPAVGRQPAEGRDRQVARPGGGAAASSTSPRTASTSTARRRSTASPRSWLPRANR